MRTSEESAKKNRRTGAIAGGVALALLLAGCGGADDDDATSASPTDVATDPAGTETQTDAEAPTDGTAEDGEAVDPADHIQDEVLLEQVEWVLAQLDGAAQGPVESEIEERFSADMLAELSPDQLATVFAQLRTTGPYTVTAAGESRSPLPTATLALDSDIDPMIMTLSIDGDQRVAGLFFAPDTSGDVPDLGSWGDLDDALGELGGQTQIVVGSVEDGVCTVEHTTEGVADGGVPAPSGSVFKLVVLAGVADAVESGDLAWDDELTITDDVRSLPSGILQDRESGSTVTVQEAASLMISISDNTATDLLMTAVGQNGITEVAERAGLDTARVLPMATTREFFQLGWQVEDEIRSDWSRADSPDERRTILDSLPGDLDVDPLAVTEPRWQDGVDWMLTGGEICSLHALLQQQAAADGGEPVREILAENPGVPVPDGAAYQGFKGGSAPGVLAMSFYLETDDDAGSGRVLVLQTASEAPIDQMRAATLAEAGLALVAQE